MGKENMAPDSERDIENYRLIIEIPSPVLCFPKEYQEILQKVKVNHYYLGTVGHGGGAINTTDLESYEKDIFWEKYKLWLNSRETCCGFSKDMVNFP